MKEQANIGIFQVLKKRIIEMEYEPGMAISEKVLIEEFEVSRTPVREALLKLSQIGLIEMVPRIGTFVTQIDLMMVKHAYEVKKNLEGLAAELACKRATEDEINELFIIIERFKHYDIVNDYKLCIQDDQRFHAIVRKSARNPILLETLDEMNTKTARFLQYIHYIIDDYEWFTASLTEMADAIRNRDQEAARKSTENHTLKFLEQLSSNFFGNPLL
jgi:DNA-binding GntR family transcriptional regulator